MLVSIPSSTDHTHILIVTVTATRCSLAALSWPLWNKPSTGQELPWVDNYTYSSKISYNGLLLLTEFGQ